MRATVARGRLPAFGTRFGLRAHHVSECDGLERLEREGREGNGKNSLHAGDTSAEQLREMLDFLAPRGPIARKHKPGAFRRRPRDHATVETCWRLHICRN
jgi:hypothetical protein